MGFDQIEDLDEAVPISDFERESLPFEAGFLAGKAFIRCRSRGGARHSPLPDFYIGAHAAVRGYRLLTRDVARCRTHFPSVELVVPACDDKRRLSFNEYLRQGPHVEDLDVGRS